jgi:hypothetical protein
MKNRFVKAMFAAIGIFFFATTLAIGQKKTPKKVENIKDSLGLEAGNTAKADFENYFSKCGDSYYTEIATTKLNYDEKPIPSPKLDLKN